MDSEVVLHFAMIGDQALLFTMPDMQDYQNPYFIPFIFKACGSPEADFETV